MKRTLLFLLTSLLVGYVVAYMLLPQRRPTPLRNAGKFAHVREFPYDWQVSVFYPAGLVEWGMIAANPKPFLSNPAWSTVPQLIVLEGRTCKATIPPRVLRHHK